MKRCSTMMLAVFLLLAGCAGTHTPKLVRCTGPYRYANPYGTVLPTLPIPGQRSPAAAAPAAPPSTGGAVPTPDPAAPPPLSSPAAHSDPGKTSWLAPAYPSC